MAYHFIHSNIVTNMFIISISFNRAIIGVDNNYFGNNYFHYNNRSNLLLENKNPEALDLIMKSNESLMPELRPQTIGGIIFILSGMKERSLALRFAIEDFKLRPAFSKIIQIILLGIIGNPFYFSLISITWLILWFIIPITTFSKIALILCVFLFGIIPIIILPKDTKGIGIFLIFSWFVTIFMYLLKTFHIYLQIGILIGFIVALLLELVMYESLFRNEGKGHTIY